MKLYTQILRGIESNIGNFLLNASEAVGKS